MKKIKVNKFKYWPNKKEDLSKYQAAFIKMLRCIKGYSWRLVSEAYCDKYSKSRSRISYYGNQLHGMDVCRYAAEHFGENFMYTPWN